MNGPSGGVELKVEKIAHQKAVHDDDDEEEEEESGSEHEDEDAGSARGEEDDDEELQNKKKKKGDDEDDDDEDAVKPKKSGGKSTKVNSLQLQKAKQKNKRTIHGDPVFIGNPKYHPINDAGWKAGQE